MPVREGIYDLMIWRDYKLKIHQVVLYTGNRKMRMPDSLDTGGVQVKFELIDIRELDAETLLKSDRRVVDHQKT